MRAYAGFGTVLECNGKFQWGRKVTFLQNWISSMVWWSR
jgi:hypothetical protein